MEPAARSVVLFTDIPSLEGQRLKVRPTGRHVLVERQEHREYKGVFLPHAESIACQTARVLATGPGVEGVFVHDEVLFVSTIGRKVDDRELRTKSGNKVWLLEEKDCVAVIKETSIQPCGERVLLRMPPRARTLPSGIVVFQAEALLVIVSDVLAIGPKVREVQAGQKVIHHKIEPLRIDNPWLRDRFGDDLGLLGKEEMCRATVEYAPGDPEITGHGYPLTSRK